MTHIYIIKYEKEQPLFFAPYSKTETYSIICKNEKEIIKNIEVLYNKHTYIYPKNLEIQTLYLSDNEIKKLKEIEK